MKEELKPCHCPFCGQTPILVDKTLDKDRPLMAFVCPPESSCRGSNLIIVFFGEDKDKAIAAWNRRAPAATVPAAPESLGFPNYCKRCGKVVPAYLRECDRCHIQIDTTAAPGAAPERTCETCGHVKDSLKDCHCEADCDHASLWIPSKPAPASPFAPNCYDCRMKKLASRIMSLVESDHLTAAMCLRFLASLDAYEWFNTKQHEQNKEPTGESTIPSWCPLPDAPAATVDREKISSLLKSYRCQSSYAEPADEGASLVDVLSIGGDDIKCGNEEIELLADFLASGLVGHLIDAATVDRALFDELMQKAEVYLAWDEMEHGGSADRYEREQLAALKQQADGRKES